MSPAYRPSQQGNIRRFEPGIEPLADDQELPFADSLSSEEIQRALEEEGVDFGHSDSAFYTPQRTLWAFLSQVLSQGVERSCKAAVHRVIVLCLLCGRPAPSPDTGPYCRARGRITVALVQRLTLQTASSVEEQLPDFWLWNGRRTFLVDGTTLEMPDTEKNQAQWPQSKSQQPGLGQPMLRMAVLFSLASGMICGLAEGPCQGKETGETALLRELLDLFRPGDVVVADRYYCSYFMIALLQQAGVDVVMKLHQRRKFDASQGRRLGKGDLLVLWKRPPRPEWMDAETYAALPEELSVRLLQVQVKAKGWRVKEFALATTLLDPQAYTSASLAELYFWRWHAELDIRNVTISMQLDDLRCKTPEMVRKELWMHCLAYNLVRRRMAQAALAGGLAGMAGLGGAWAQTVWKRLGPQGQGFAAGALQNRGPSPVRYLSFASALQITKETWLLVSVLRGERRRELSRMVLLMIASGRLADRPFRVEPRAIKRRPKRHKLLREPRRQAREKLLSGEASAA